LKPTPWTVPNRWRGKACFVSLGSAVAELRLADDKFPRPADFALVNDHWEIDKAATAAVCICTDARLWDASLLQEGTDLRARYLAPGRVNGLEGDRTKVSGRCVPMQALSLAVHLGASRIILGGADCLDDRDVRNLETTVRPLKSRRISVCVLDDERTPVDHLWPRFDLVADALAYRGDRK
jgi:hypothetical protein